MPEQVNAHGVEEKDLVLTLINTHIPARRFIEAIRALQGRAITVEAGLDEFTPSDHFVLQMASVIRESSFFDGTHTLLPDDIMKLLFPMKEEACQK